jgi:hypothetical protein
MKNLKYLFGILSILLIVSCKPLQNTTVTKEIIRIDTVRDYKVITKFNAVHDTLTIENPCDSSGILTNFYSRIRIPQGKVVVRSVQGNIQATVDIDSIENVYEKKYRSLVGKSDVNTQKFVRINVIPKWVIWFMAISGVLSFLYIREKLSIFVK